MNSGHTSERVYDAIKDQLKTRAFRPGDRLDPTQLASELSSSVTPVREALNRLTGEALVEARTGDGFRMPTIDEPALQDLYLWNAEVLALASRAWRDPTASAGRGASPDLPAQATSDLFSEVALASVNAEHARVITALNDRLHATRLIEAQILSDLEAELSELRSWFTVRDGRSFRHGIARYHRRRRAASASLLRAHYRMPVTQ